MKTGIVKFFNNNPGKQFGFIIPEDGGRDIFFHYTDGKAIRQNSSELYFDDERVGAKPKEGDRILFEIRQGAKGPKAAPWGFYRLAETAMPKQTVAQMNEIIMNAKPGNKLVLQFANKTHGGDLKGRLYMLLAMQGQSIDFGEMQMFNLVAVANSNQWCSFLDYTVTVLDAFDPEYFSKRTLGREMLESVQLLG